LLLVFSALVRGTHVLAGSGSVLHGSAACSQGLGHRVHVCLVLVEACQLMLSQLHTNVFAHVCKPVSLAGTHWFRVLFEVWHISCELQGSLQRMHVWPSLDCIHPEALQSHACRVHWLGICTHLLPLAHELQGSAVRQALVQEVQDWAPGAVTQPAAPHEQVYLSHWYGSCVHLLSG
jgi:hypothetical protein